jgi:hypothetical protein
LHTELIPRLGPLEGIFNTPSAHRVHHAINANYLDRNFGGVLVVFDRFFGTYVPECAENPPRYGLIGECRGSNPLHILADGWIRLTRAVARARSFGGQWTIAAASSLVWAHAPTVSAALASASSSI